MRAGLTPAEIRTLPAVVDLVTAGRALGVGRTKCYELARAGRFPCPVLRVGRSYLVPTTGLLTLLGLDDGAGPPAPESE
ncbi:DNA-binding protein [Actinomadura sp. 3N508]|uniref:DNA-binding protein n=1 Tax=Actinomadura sp. 3N508 TaxID=3375153 RepID=UPI0037A93A90